MMNRGTRRRGGRGFTLIELLIVIAIIGLIASILIPNLIDALQKAKQKRTLASMRNLGTSWMSWLTDQVGAGAAGMGLYDASALTVIDYAVLREYLQPSIDMYYASNIPRTDGWKHEFFYCQNDSLLEATVIMICSPGRNGLLGDNPGSVSECCGNGIVWQSGQFIATDYDQDIVWADGFMVRTPTGVTNPSP